LGAGLLRCASSSLEEESVKSYQLVPIAIFAIGVVACGQQPLGSGWPTYGGDPGGTRYSTSSQITRNNLSQLHAVWTFHTHALDNFKSGSDIPSFETTSVLSGDTLYLTSPYDVVSALDARTGTERWHYNPRLAPLTPGGITTSRGVALWPLAAAPEPNSSLCSRRVFIATLDARLISLDANAGQLCTGFGDNGSVDLRNGIDFQNIGYYGMTSPPTVVGNVVVVGSYVGDNQQVDTESGAVRGFDAATGKLLWSWEPLPWARSQKIRTGAGNAWSILSADPALGLVYVPTGSPSPDYYGGMRPGDNRDADSVVALDAATGRKVWAFQVVHHDVWDYDVASEPILFTWRGSIPAIAITTKMGMIFLLDRRTGAPLVPVQERSVPKSDVPGETLSPTQPFQDIPLLAPIQLGDTSSSVYRRSAADDALCRKELADLRYYGIYTPPSLQGSLLFPGNVGGVNWGGAAIDPTTGILYANTNRDAFTARLIPRHGLEQTERDVELYFWHWQTWLALLLLFYLADSLRSRSFKLGIAPLFIVPVAALCFFTAMYIRASRLRAASVPVLAHFGYELSPQRKSPFLIERHPVVDSQGFSCTPAPWGAISAVNLNTLASVWEKPLGSMIRGQHTGVLNFGGPIVTASGLVFTAAADDPWLRVFDAASGDQLREIPLPVPAQSTPMTFTLDGRQYLVVAAGGHGDGYAKLGDSLIAFAIN
jgi:quinoprotein glucose dehydrogenase